MCLDSVVAIVAYNISQTFLENSVEFRVFDRVKFESAVYHRKTPAFEMLLLKNIPTFFLRITIQEGSKQFSSPLSKCFSIFLWFFKWYGVDGRSFEVCAAVKESSVFVGLLKNNLIPYTLQIPEKFTNRIYLRWNHQRNDCKISLENNRSLLSTKCWDLSLCSL